MTLRVSLGGRMGIDVDGRPVDVSALGRLGQLFCAYLVCERHRPVTRDELAELLWGHDELPRSWDQMLRAHTSRARAVLAAAGLDLFVAVTTALGPLKVHLPADAVVDVEE